jgi:hypothetical protein
MMILLIMLGALLALTMAVINGRRRVRRNRAVTAHFVSFRLARSRPTDTTIGLRDPARPL